MATKKQVLAVNALYINIHCVFWLSYASVWAMLAIILSYKGFSNTEIGIIASVSALLSLFVQQVLSALTDRLKRLTSKRMAVAMSVFIAADLIVIWKAPIASHFLYGALFVACGICFSAMGPFYNAMAMEQIRRGIPLNFGLGRGIGSTLYALGVTFAGVLIEKFNPLASLPFAVIFSLATIIAFAIFRGPKGEGAPVAVEEGEVQSLFSLFKKQPYFVLMAVGVLFLIASHSIISMYMKDLVARCGGGESSVGISLAIGAVVELPAMALFGKFRKRFSCEALLLLSAAFFVVKLALFIFTFKIWVLYAVQALEFFEYGLYLPASVYYVSEHIDAANQVKGQAVMHAAGAALGSAFGNFFGGLIMDGFGLTATLLFGLSSALLGFTVVAASVKMGRKGAHKAVLSAP